MTRMMSLSPERRHSPRAPYEILIQYESEGKLLTANAEEISERGVKLEVPGTLPLGSRVVVLVPLRGRYGKIDTCRIRGTVVHQLGSTVGVAFEKLLPRHMLQLRDFVHRSHRISVSQSLCALWPR